MMLTDLQQATASLADRAWPEDRDNPHLADCLIARLAEETGELAQTVRLLAGPRPGRPGEAAATIEQVEDEIGDCLFLLARIALATGASLETAAWRVIGKIERRIHEMLENGVVVVPVEELRKRLFALIRATADMVLSERRKFDDDQLDEELKDLSAMSQTTAKMESRLGSFIERLSRLQQNWEQPAETRITVTIDVQTWQGYHDRRVIEVEPGIGWPERMAPEVLKAALEMEEQFLRRGLQQNGGEGR